MLKIAELAEGLEVVGTPVGLGVIGLTALTLRSKKGRSALRSIVVGMAGLVLGVVDGAKEIVEGIRHELAGVADEARESRLPQEHMNMQGDPVNQG